MATWLISYRNDRDQHAVSADRIREVGSLLAFSDDCKEPFLFVSNEVIDTITLLDPEDDEVDK